ncbi:MAG: type II secretion system protein [Rhodocyclaceae bacterium]|jgi:MSHA biogenesis protein MshO|nr:type II secretion system protein [Rhodocyclaceae bacterium]
MRARGFTLIEMITVITITGIVAAMVAVFIRAPVQGYVDSVRRAWMTDVADTALRRIARDVQAALPNSLRPNSACVASTTTSCGIELLLTTTGGRYSEDAADAAGCFAGGCTTLTSLGSVISANGELAGQRLIIYNLHNNDSGTCSATYPSAYCGNNSATITGSTDAGTSDTFSFGNTAFRPATGSPSRTFFVVSGPVAYVCANVGASGGNGTGTLWRFENYPIASGATFPPVGGTARLLAHHVSACNLNYAPAVAGTNGLLELYLEIMEEGERVGLHHEVHVDNAP